MKREFDIPEAHAKRRRAQPAAWTVKDQIKVVFEEHLPVFASGNGNPALFVPRCRELGIKVIALVGNGKNARRVQDASVDIVVAQGHAAALGPQPRPLMRGL